MSLFIQHYADTDKAVVFTKDDQPGIATFHDIESRDDLISRLGQFGLRARKWDLMTWGFEAKLRKL